MHVWEQLNVALHRVDGDPLPAARALFATLAPLIEAARADGAIDLFFFQRKTPDVRLRFGREAAPGSPGALAPITDVLDALARAGVVDRWFHSPYEPEVRKFGGLGVTDAVHRHFDANTRLWMVGQRLRFNDPAAAEPPPILLATVGADTLFVQTLLDRDEVWDAWANLADIASTPEPAARAALDQALANGAWALAGPAASRDQDPLFALASSRGAAPIWAGPELVAATRAITDVATALRLELDAGRLRVGPRAIVPFVAQLDFQRWGLDGSQQGAAATAMMHLWDPANGLRGA